MKPKELCSFFIIIIKKDSNDLTWGKLPATARFENAFQMLQSEAEQHTGPNDLECNST